MPVKAWLLEKKVTAKSRRLRCAITTAVSDNGLSELETAKSGGYPAWAKTGQSGFGTNLIQSPQGIMACSPREHGSALWLASIDPARACGCTRKTSSIRDYDVE